MAGKGKSVKIVSEKNVSDVPDVPPPEGAGKNNESKNDDSDQNDLKSESGSDSESVSEVKTKYIEKKVLNLKPPPNFDPDEDDDYWAWKNEIMVWKYFTDISKDKIGAAIYLSLKGKARRATRGITPQEINCLSGYDTLIAKLDKVYLKDEATLAYCAFKEFYEYKRSTGTEFSEFIVE